MEGDGHGDGRGVGAKGVVPSSKNMFGFIDGSVMHPVDATAPRSGERAVCSHCSKVGHEKAPCYELIGYPEGWGRARLGSREGRSGGRGGRDPVHAYANAVYGAGASSAGASVARVLSAISIPGLSDAQVQQIIAILAKSDVGASNEGASNKKLNGKIPELDWILDSGASHHMTGDFTCLHNVCTINPTAVGLPNGEQTVAKHEGDVVLSEGFVLERVLYVPSLECNLISISKLVSTKNCLVTFTNELCLIQNHITRMLIGVGEQKDGVYYYHRGASGKALHVNRKGPYDLWHQRMGHPSRQITLLLAGFDNNNDSKDVCEICMRAKQTRDIFPDSLNKAAHSFDLIHCDIWGPYRVGSHCGAHYFLTIVDDHTRAVWVYLMAEKSETSHLLKSFCKMVQTQFGVTVKCIRSDNGLEFQSHHMKQFYAESGILHQTSCVFTPQQNGRVERKHRHILNVARALRFQANLPLEFWGECILTAAYLINRTPTQVLSNKTPYELLFGKAPSYAAVRNFGCLCYIKSRTSDKFESRSRKCAFVGYPYGKKGWKVFDLETQEFIISRDIIFCEDVYPFSEMTSKNAPASDLSGQNAPRVGQSDDAMFIQLANNRRTIDHLLDNERVEARGSSHVFDDSESTDDQSAPTSGLSAPALSSESAPTSSRSAPASPSESAPALPGESAPVSLDESALASGPSAPASSQNAPTSEQVAPRRSRHPPARLQDYICYTAKCDPSYAHPTSTATSGTPYPIAHYVNCDKFSVAHRKFLAAITAKKEPDHFGEAMKDINWRKAMQTEIEALERNNTWSIEDLPSNKKAIGCKWVYRIKYNSDGSVERYKARLVVLGNRQVEGIDFKETFAPVAKMVSVRTFLAVAVAKDWELHQMDVHNAFLHGDLHEEVYMRLPPGFASKYPGKVCRLRKSLYGLRQAPRMWFSKLTEALQLYGFTQSYADYSLFTMKKGNVFLAILVYVDDLVIAGNDSEAIVQFKQYLSCTFYMKDLGALKYFLGIEIARNRTGLYLCQRKYTLDIVAECGLLGGKPAAFPIEQNHNLSIASGKPMKDPERYRRLIGRLIYLTITRPDLCYSVHILAQFMHAPLDVHYDAAIRVMRYLKGSPGQGILLSANSDLTLYGYCDSDWAACPLTRRSLTGYFVMLGTSPISWKTKKQHTVSRSSAEAEYRSMATTACELTWLKTLLQSLGVSHAQPMKLMCDSQAALHIAANPVFHERTKHIEIDCHFVRDQIQAGCIVASHIRTNEQLADIFTKALGKRQFHYLLDKLGILNLHAQLEGEYYGNNLIDKIS
ncbi:Retroelement pol polyprotein-like [Rhynchospora pubera]|uniref:Retroelement pol polyprotein-like n=1 Tax=Rhynchospora pubera TaxID=906938 RepID=A0AAV8BY74_9POAL|nr:Retroelement pol polyprotein-like [Rhynchospora pubera]